MSTILFLVSAQTQCNRREKRVCVFTGWFYWCFRYIIQRACDILCLIVRCPESLTLVPVCGIVRTLSQLLKAC